MAGNEDPVCAAVKEIQEYAGRAFEEQMARTIELYKRKYGKKPDTEVIKNIKESLENRGGVTDSTFGVGSIEKIGNLWAFVPVIISEGGDVDRDGKVKPYHGGQGEKKILDLPDKEIVKRIVGNGEYTLIRAYTGVKEMTLELVTNYQGDVKPTEFQIKSGDTAISGEVHRVGLNPKNNAFVWGLKYRVMRNGHEVGNRESEEIFGQYENKIIKKAYAEYGEILGGILKKIKADMKMGTLSRMNLNLNTGTVMISVQVKYNDLCQNSNL